MPARAAKSPMPPFEAALEEIEAIVRTLEEARPGLEDSLAHYERGVALIAHCQATLDKAEQRVSVLRQGRKEAFTPEGNAGHD
jgi:exodeoxyribonuclease VII small subunit